MMGKGGEVGGGRGYQAGVYQSFPQQMINRQRLDQVGLPDPIA